MVQLNKTIKGYAALMGVMLIGTVALIFSSFILFDGISQSRLSLGSIRFEAAKYSATTCLEDTLLRVKQADIFDRNLSYQIDGDHSCTTIISYSAEVPGTPPYYPVTLTVTGTGFNVQRTFEYNLRVDSYDVHYVTGAQERLHNIDILSIEETT